VRRAVVNYWGGDCLEKLPSGGPRGGPAYRLVSGRHCIRYHQVFQGLSPQAPGGGHDIQGKCRVMDPFDPRTV